MLRGRLNVMGELPLPRSVQVSCITGLGVHTMGSGEVHAVALHKFKEGGMSALSQRIKLLCTQEKFTIVHAIVSTHCPHSIFEKYSKM